MALIRRILIPPSPHYEEIRKNHCCSEKIVGSAFKMAPEVVTGLTMTLMTLIIRGLKASRV